MIEIQIFKYFRNLCYDEDKEVLSPLRRLEEGSNSPKTPIRGNENLARAVASRAIFKTPRATLPVQRAVLQTPDKVDPIDPVSSDDSDESKGETESIASEGPIVSRELIAWMRKIMFLAVKERVKVLKADLEVKTDIYKALKAENMLTTCLFCSRKHARSYTNKRRCRVVVLF